MEQLELSPLRRARHINLDPHFYGTFAEIGAGQEVARYFFMAGRASQTIAKTISAYDMTVSDSVYGRSARYVCEERVLKMIDHEYRLLLERLGPQRGAKTRFFAFADTVATSSHAEPTAKCHGWLGVRFQLRPEGPTHDLIVHVRMRDRTRILQQEALGVLGVNMIHVAHEPPTGLGEIVDRITQDLSHDRVEVNLIRLSGPDLSHIDNRLLNLEMIKKGFTEAVLFEPDGAISNPSDSLFHQPVLVQRGTFRPVTNVNVFLLERGLDQFKAGLSKDMTPQVLFELTMEGLTSEGRLQDSDFLDRVDTLCALGHRVLLSKFKFFYEVKTFLRAYTDRPIALIIGAAHLQKLFDPEFYKPLRGGIVEGFSRLFDENTKMLVFPFKSKELCVTTKTYRPNPELAHLYQHFVTNGMIVDLANCDDIDTSIHSQDVRYMLATGDLDWQKLVPAQVRDLILKRKMFGSRG